MVAIIVQIPYLSEIERFSPGISGLLSVAYWKWQNERMLYE